MAKFSVENVADNEVCRVYYYAHVVFAHPAPLDVMLRSLVLDQLGRYGDEDTIKEAQSRFSDHCSGKRPLPSDLKTTVFTICLANGDNTTFDQLIQVRY